MRVYMAALDTKNASLSDYESCCVREYDAEREFVVFFVDAIIHDAEAEALPFLQACTKEGLRIFPPSMGLMGKVCPHHDTICGVKVPANTKVACSALAIMNNRSILGENADVYDPQWWIDAPMERRREMDAFYELGNTIFEVGAISQVPRPLVFQLLRILQLFRWFDFALVDPVVPFRLLDLLEFLHQLIHKISRTIVPHCPRANVSNTTVDNANANANAAPARAPSRSGEQATESPHLTNANIAWTMISLCLSVFLSALDLTIVTPAIPAIVGSLKSAAGYTWVGGAYTLAYAAITPVWGSVSDIWGRKPIMLIAVAVFLVGSLVCALAPKMNALIVGRAIQGLGGSVPVGAVSFLVLLFFLRVQSPRTPIAAGLRVIDWTGSVLIVGGALMVLLALEFGDVVYSWSSATVICLLIFGAAAMALFVVNEWKIAKNPIIPLWLFTSPTKIVPYVVFACNSYVFIGQAYYIPLYAQSVLAASALMSGLYLLPLIVSYALAAAAAGMFMQRTGKYLPVMYIAQGLLVLGSGLLISLKFESDITKIIIFQILVGIGVGMNIEAPILAAQAATSVRHTAAVTATMGFARSLSTAISVVVGGVVFQNEMNAKNGELANRLGSSSFLASIFNGDNAASSVEEISTIGLNADQQLLVRKTYFEALRTVWVMYVAFAGLATILNLFVRARKLRSENEGVVLGIDRSRQEGSPTNGVAKMEL
ncbi:cytochrome P450 [Penicillium atrosanguineum]|uniref:Cytochrome P450 n=1 Tax=Penicillium atrosanguineum TaxID=1132637 RepID=A0A9W9PPI9_9EURO|nr:cytochrome P450 [Penicillium atrosanguineum]